MDLNLNTAFTISTCDMHTAGEPLRIILAGFPCLIGKNLLQKRKYAMENLELYRKCLMHEPRGHYDMYGALITEPDDSEEADFAVLFLNNEGYSTMCGHAIIALGRYAIDSGLIKRALNDQNEIRIQCPCGVVKAMVESINGSTGNVKFHSVPAFAYKLDVEVNVPNYGNIKLDISFGGAFYAILPADRIGLDFKKSSISNLISAATAITETIKEKIPVTHPLHSDLSFLYGTILTDGHTGLADNSTKNICVYAKSAWDRSPTGSGVTARMALMYARKEVCIQELCNFKSFIDTPMTGRIISESSYEGFPSVVVEVGGRAFYTGMHKFILEKDDPISKGILIKA